MKKHKSLIISLFLLSVLIAKGYGYNWHGCAFAPGSYHGWAVTIETTLVVHTWNSGVNWEQQQISTTRDFFDVFFLDSLNGWTANRLAMIWHSDDGGVSWHWQNLGGAKFATRIFFLDYSFGWAACGEAIVLRTADSGSTWIQIDLHNYLPADTVDFYGVSFVDEMNGWMAAGRYPELDTGGQVVFKQGQGYIVHSENGGDSWVLQRRDTVYDFFDVKFRDTFEGWVVGGNDSTNEACVLHTTDGGLNWNPLSIPNTANYLRALELVDGSKLWAVGRNGTIIYSPDGGNSWTIQTTSFDTTLFDVDFADSLRGLIAGNGVVLYTQDGGNTWLQADVPGSAIGEIIKSEPQVVLKAYPNPFSRNTSIQMLKSSNPERAFQIYNTTGKLVANLNPQSNSGGFAWDGRDYQGNEVGPGVYFGYIRLENNISNQKLRLVKVK